MSNEATLQVRLYNADNTGYGVLPLSENGSPGVKSASARVTAAEGYADGTLVLTGARRDYPALARRRRVAFYAVYRRRADDAVQTALLYRGVVKRVLPVKGSKGERSLSVKLVGLWSEIGRVRCYKVYPNAEGADRASFFAALAGTFVLPKYPGVAVATGAVGSVPDYVSAYDKTFAEAVATLQQNVGQVATGMDVDPVTGADRLFFRPFDDLSAPARHAIPLPDAQTGRENVEEDGAAQVTVLTIRGGEPRGGGNLLADAVQNNASFEFPELPGSASVGNYLQNGSLETGNFFDEINGGTTKNKSDEGIQPFLGDWYGYLGKPGAALAQSVWSPPSPLAPGRTYRLDLRARLENQSFPVPALALIEWFQGTAISHVALGSVPLAVSPTGATWDLFGINLTPPAGANAFRFSVTRAPSVPGEPTTGNDPYVLFVDDVRFFDPSPITQKGWELFRVGTNVVYNAVDWASDLSPWHNGRCCFFDAVSRDVDGQDCQLRPFGYNRTSVTGGTTLVAGFAVRVTRGAVLTNIGGTVQNGVFTTMTPTLKFQVGIENWATDGHPQGETVTSYVVPADGAWRYVSHTKTIGGDTAQATCRLMMRGEGAYYADAAFLMAADAPFARAVTANTAGFANGTLTSTAMPDPALYVEGKQYRRRYRAVDLFAAGTPIGDEAFAVGEIEATEDLPEVVSDNDALSYARLYFKKFSLPLSRPNLETEGVLETGAASSTAGMMPGESARFLGPDGTELFPSPLSCVEKLVAFEGGKLSITPFFGVEERDPYRSIEEMIRAARLSGTQTGAGSLGGLSGGSGSAGGGYPTAPSPHAASHGVGGTDPITPASIGAEAGANKGVPNGYPGLGPDGKVLAGQLPPSVVGSVTYVGTWDASANTPALASGVGTKGYYYVVAVAGTTAVDGVARWNVGDWIVYDGAKWDKLDGIASEVLSVNGQTGVVMIPAFGGSGAGHGAGLVPDPGPTPGTSRFLREDGAFAVPPSGGAGTFQTTEEDASAFYQVANFNSHVVADCYGGNINVTLPVITGAADVGKTVTMVRQDSYGANSGKVVTVIGGGPTATPQTIRGTLALRQLSGDWQSVTLRSARGGSTTGYEWHVISKTYTDAGRNSLNVNTSAA